MQVDGNMAYAKTAMLLAAAVALFVAGARAQHAFCDNLAEYPRGRPEAPNWTNAVDQLRSEVEAADQPGQVQRRISLQVPYSRQAFLSRRSAACRRSCAQPVSAAARP